MRRVNPVGAIANGSADGPPRIVDVGRRPQDRGAELDVFECLARACQRQLPLGGTVGVVERGRRRAAFRDQTQVVDGERRLQPPFGGAPGGLLEPQ
jgi:hypothetical protein